MDVQDGSNVSKSTKIHTAWNSNDILMYRFRKKEKMFLQDYKFGLER